MKSLIKVTGLIALAGAAFFALNAGSALAAPPPPWEDITPHVLLDPPVDPPEIDLPGLCEVIDCGQLQPLDPCILLGTCGSDDGDSDDPAVDPTVTPTEAPTVSPTVEPDVTLIDQSTSVKPDEPSIVAPQAGDQAAERNDSSSNGFGLGLAIGAAAGMSALAMGLALVLFFVSRRKEEAES